MTVSLSTSFQPMMSEKRGATSPLPGSGSLLCNAADASYSPTPGADMSSHSGSPGSASDHMGNLHENQAGQPLYPGSSSIAALDSGSHVNRVITTTAQKQPEGGEGSSNGASSNGNRRHKRLQRNRESARLSRRRRKQYLEVLEARVDKFSHDLDKGRREHVAQAVSAITQQRVQMLLAPPTPNTLPALSTSLSRTSPELMLATTFQAQQLKSFATPSANKFVLWLTLQTDKYFRGGRAASERLSAARIGERMLSSGTKRAGPSQSMWPLFCNEIGLSYDQEEKVRNFQRLLIQNPKTWLDRHVNLAAAKVVRTNHDAVQALTLRLGQREKSSLSTLSETQRLNLLAWSVRNRDRVAHSTSNVVPTNNMAPMRVTSKQQHVAANLYILNERLQNVLKTIPSAAPMVTGIALKKLSRRACFESLGATDEKGNVIGLTRENSFASSGSLKRSASEMSIEDDKQHVPQISPIEAQATVAPVIEQALGFVRDLLPPPPVVPLSVASESNKISPYQNIPMPIPVTSLAYQAPAVIARSHPNFSTIGGEPIAPFFAEEPASKHTRKSSFLPDNLKVVPEEMWPADEADDFLLDMIEGDWAIGEGIDMDLEG